MPLSNDELYHVDAVEVRFTGPGDADRAASRPEVGGILRSCLAGDVARVRPWLIHELRSHLDALGIPHEERAAMAA